MAAWPPRRLAESSERICRYMRWHGMYADFNRISRAGHSGMDPIRQRAKEAGADLLVMGGYGHSRIRELVCGGFTQRIIHGVDLPVLMFH